MVSKILKKIGIFTTIIPLGFSFVFADLNGVWHNSEDIRGGVFGSDEGTPEYFFLNKVGFGTSTISSNNQIEVNGSISVGNIYDKDSSTQYYIDLNQNSRIKNLKTDYITTDRINFSTATLNGNNLNNIFINVGESGDSILDNTIDSTELEDGTITGTDIKDFTISANDLNPALQKSITNIWQKNGATAYYYNTVAIGKNTANYKLDVKATNNGLSISAGSLALKFNNSDSNNFGYLGTSTHAGFFKSGNTGNFGIIADKNFGSRFEYLNGDKKNLGVIGYSDAAGYFKNNLKNQTVFLSTDSYSGYFLNDNGHYGLIGTPSMASYFKNKNGNYGYIGSSSYGGYFRNSNGNYGFLGSSTVGGYFRNKNNNYGYIGSNGYGGYFRNKDGNYGYIGSEDYAGYFRNKEGYSAQLGTSNHAGLFGKSGGHGAALVIDNAAGYFLNKNNNYALLGENSKGGQFGHSSGNNAIIASSSSAGSFEHKDGNYVSLGTRSYSVYGNSKIRGSEICFGNNCYSGIQANKKPNSAGGFDWTTVFHETYEVGNGNWNRYRSVKLDSNKPVLGIRISGYTDDGGLCIAGVDNYFHGAIGYGARVTSLNQYGTWSGRANDGRAGNMLTKEFLIDDLSSGIYSYTTVGSSTKQGFFDLDLFHVKAGTWTYYKPLGIDFIPPGKYLEIKQWYNDGGGGAKNTCKVEVLYGEFN